MRVSLFRLRLFAAFLLCIAILALLHAAEREKVEQTLSPGMDPVMVQYESVRAELLGIVEHEGVQRALVVFRERIVTLPLLSGLCHPLAHEIGHAAYDKYGLEGAIDVSDDICGSGYLHGVIETHFAHVEDIKTALTMTCPPEAGKCFHGLGHGLMYASRNNVPQSLSYCDLLSQRSERVQCAEGVFMENVNTDFTMHPTQFLRAEDPFYPCADQPDRYKAACAFYAPRFYIRLHPDAYREALAWCSGVNGYRSACAKGVGSVAMKQNMHHPKFAEQVCLASNDAQRQPCIEGLVSYYIVHFASAEKGESLCPLLQEAHRTTCERVVRESRQFYPSPA